MALGPCGCEDYHLADCPTRDPLFALFEPIADRIHELRDEEMGDDELIEEEDWL